LDIGAAGRRSNVGVLFAVPLETGTYLLQAIAVERHALTADRKRRQTVQTFSAA